jgi:hypothetical protein
VTETSSQVTTQVTAQTEPKQEVAKVAQEESKATDEDLVTAFTIQAATEKGIDYEKLLVKFGCSAMT